MSDEEERQIVRDLDSLCDDVVIGKEDEDAYWVERFMEIGERARTWVAAHKGETEA